MVLALLMAVDCFRCFEVMRLLPSRRTAQSSSYGTTCWCQVLGLFWARELLKKTSANSIRIVIQDFEVLAIGRMFAADQDTVFGAILVCMTTLTRGRIHFSPKAEISLRGTRKLVSARRQAGLEDSMHQRFSISSILADRQRLVQDGTRTDSYKNQPAFSSRMSSLLLFC